MKIIDTNHADVIRLATSTLKSNGIIIVPTTRWYMLCCGANNSDGLERIFTAKIRSYSKPPLFFVPNKQTAKKLFVINKYANRLIEKLWPSELAMYLDWNSNASANAYCLEDKTHALVSMLPGLFGDIVSNYAEPVLSTTANVSNLNKDEDIGPAISLDETLSFISTTGIGVDLVIDGGICPAFNHTTLVDCRGEGAPIIIREGYVHKRAINYVLKMNDGGFDNE